MEIITRNIFQALLIIVETSASNLEDCNWVSHAYRESLLQYKAMNVESRCRMFVELWSDSIQVAS